MQGRDDKMRQRRQLLRESVEGGQQKSEAGQLESLLEGVTGSEQRRRERPE